MDNRPLGCFGSGLGGVTSIPYLRKALPGERVIYFGDTARTPYGSKSVNTITRFSAQISDFLVEEQVKMIVIACNTVSANCLEFLRQRHPNIPVVGIVAPAAQRTAMLCGQGSNVGVIGTKATINSHAYRDLIAKTNPYIHIYELACPAFVPLIEEGFADSDIMDLTIRHYMDAYVLENRLDTLVLGCTHYPLIESNIRRRYPNLRILNPSEIVIQRIADILKERDAFAEEDKENPVDNVFYASDLSDNFIRMIDAIFVDSNEKVAFKNLDV